MSTKTELEKLKDDNMVHWKETCAWEQLLHDL